MDMQFSCEIFIDASEEVTNFARVVCILLEKGTECMQRVMTNHLPHGCQTVDEAVNAHSEDLLKLRHITDRHARLLGLAPAGCNAVINTASIDMSLWYTLIRNISTLKTVKWGRLERKTPKPTAVKNQHDIIRLRNFRNYLVHLPFPKLENAEFDDIWRKLSAVLKRLGVSDDKIDEYMQNQTFNPVQVMSNFVSLQKQVQRDLEGYYQTELKKKRLMMVGLLVMVVAVVLAAAFTCWVIYRYSQTWKSCISKMTFRGIGSITVPAISYMPRDAWGAAKPKHINKRLPTPVDYVIISQTQATGRCMETDDCCVTARRVQHIAFYKKDDDIMYNYMVGQDGVIYEGRNTTIGAAAKGWNNRSISIAFMGTFIEHAPNDDSLYAAQYFLQYLVDTKVLSNNFTLYGLCQVRPFPDAPGCPFYKLIQTWKGKDAQNPWSWRDREGSDCCR